MLTDYLVHCPHAGCEWRGCLFPEGSRDAWRPAVPTVREVNFLCPRCRRTWRARIVGEDAIALPLEREVPASQEA
jgi:hypothetical protein